MKIDDIDFKLWKKHIGTLPEGFFVEVSNSQLFLYYRGPGYKELTEPRGKRPPEGQDHAFIGMHSVFYTSSERLERLKTEVPNFVRKLIQKTQEELSG